MLFAALLLGEESPESENVGTQSDGVVAVALGVVCSSEAASGSVMEGI